MTRPEKMSRIPLVHIKGNAVGSWIGMPKAVEAPTGLSMKLIPIAMIALGTKRVHQNSGEFFLNVEVSVPVVMFICLFRPVSRTCRELPTMMATPVGSGARRAARPNGGVDRAAALPSTFAGSRLMRNTLPPLRSNDCSAQLLDG